MTLDFAELDRLAADPSRQYSSSDEVLVSRKTLRILIEAARERASLSRERDAANESVAAAHKLVDQYRNRITQVEIERRCALESRDGQARNTAATIVERDQALSELATARAQLAQAREALEPMACGCKRRCRNSIFDLKPSDLCWQHVASKALAALTSAPDGTEKGR